MNAKTKILEVNGVVMHYRLSGGRSVRAVDGISFSVEEGRTTGIVGESGCGKSSVAGTILRTLPDNGEIKGGKIYFKHGEIAGKSGMIDLFSLSEEEIQKIRWKGISMIFQGAMNSLNPVRRVGDQIIEIMRYKDKISKEEAQKRLERLCNIVHIDPKRMRSYPHQFSGGMKQRAVIAMALSTDPKLIIADEPTTALDLITQDRIMEEIKEIQKELKMSMIFISHDLSLVSEISDRVIVMYAGKIVESCDKRSLFREAVHPYTRGLINSCPRIRGDKGKLSGIPGEPPSLSSPPKGCRFHPRCPYAIAICREEEPEYKEMGEGHFSACWVVFDG